MDLRRDSAGFLQDPCKVSARSAEEARKIRTSVSWYSRFSAKKELVWQSARAWFARRFHASWDDGLSNAAQKGRVTLLDCQTGSFLAGKGIFVGRLGSEREARLRGEGESTLSKGEGESTLPE